MEFPVSEMFIYTLQYILLKQELMKIYFYIIICLGAPVGAEGESERWHLNAAKDYICNILDQSLFPKEQVDVNFIL